MKIFIAMIFVLSSLPTFAMSPVTLEWTCFDQENDNQAFVPDETNPNKLNSENVLASAVGHGDLEAFAVTGIKQVNINIPRVGKKQYIMMSYEYNEDGVRNWGVFSCYKSN